MKSTLAAVALLALATLAGCTLHVHENYFFNPMALKTAGDRVEVQAGGATLVGRYLTHPQARATLVYFGGNAEYVDLSGETLQKLSAYRLNVLMVDYRGYGASTGSPSVDTFFPDSVEVFRFGRNLAAARRLPTMAYGFSLGGLAAGYVAAHESCDGLVLEATGTDVRSWSKLITPWYVKPFLRVRIADKFLAIDNAEWVRTFNKPLLVLGGKKDTQAPLPMSQKLFDVSSSTRKTLYVFRPGHHNEIKHAPDFEKVFSAFLETALVSGR